MEPKTAADIAPNISSSSPGSAPETIRPSLPIIKAPVISSRSVNRCSIVSTFISFHHLVTLAFGFLRHCQSLIVCLHCLQVFTLAHVGISQYTKTHCIPGRQFEQGTHIADDLAEQV